MKFCGHFLLYNLASGVPSWILGILFIYLTNEVIPFYVQSGIFIILSVNLNYLVIRTFVFKGNERGKSYIMFVGSVLVFRVVEYFFSVFLFFLLTLPLVSLLIANIMISIFKYRFLLKIK